MRVSLHLQNNIINDDDYEEIETDEDDIDSDLEDSTDDYYDEQKGRTPARIQQFYKLKEDESLIGDRCSVCQDDIEVGRRMMRLDCNGQHVFCQTLC